MLDPAVGRLTGADSGPGRLPEPAEIFAACLPLLERGRGRRGPRDLRGRHVVVSAGGTREHLDPVRFLGNRSSGRQGYALAATALARGAEVTLVAANVALPDPAGAKVVPRRLRRGAARRGPCRRPPPAGRRGRDGRRGRRLPARATSATPRSRRPAARARPDRAGAQPPTCWPSSPRAPRARRPGRRRLRRRDRRRQGDVLTHGRAKLAAQGRRPAGRQRGRRTDRGFEGPDNAAVILGADGTEVDVPLGRKEALADAVWDLRRARAWPATRRTVRLARHRRSPRSPPTA